MQLHSRVWLAAIGLTVGGVARLVAADETVRYSARPALAEVVLGGRAVPVIVASKSDSIGETDYRGLSLLPGELPLPIGMSAK